MLSDVLGRSRATLALSTSFLSFPHPMEVCYGMVILRYDYAVTYLHVGLWGDPWCENIGNSLKRIRAGDRRLQLFVLNEEFLVSARHQRALNMSLLFVHTARRCYRLNGLVSIREGVSAWWITIPVPERLQTVSFRGSTSRNKVSVGEPADGSLRFVNILYCILTTNITSRITPFGYKLLTVSI